MITKVFETITKTEVHKIKKVIDVVEQEIYYETDNRTTRVYEPPTGVSHCLHCNTLLRDSMWSYTSKNGKYLCPDCWYNLTNSAQKDKYRLEAQRKSIGGFSYKTVTSSIPKTRNVTKRKEIEIEEPITRSISKFVYPELINYSQTNSVVIEKIRVPDSPDDAFQLEAREHFDDELISSDSIWFNASSINEAFKQLSEKKKSKEKVKIFMLDHIPCNDLIVDEKQVLEEFTDIVGFYPNVPAFIQGHPLNMYNNKRKNIVNIDHVVTIYCNLALDSRCDYGHYKNRGIILYGLIEHLVLHETNYKVNVRLLDASYIDGETIIQEFDQLLFTQLDLKNPDVYELKEQQDRQFNYLYNILTHLSFYRILVLNHKAKVIAKNNLNEKWLTGFGECLKNVDLKKVLQVVDNSIIVGNPSEHGINGLYLDDDFINFAESIGIHSETDESVITASDLVIPNYTVQDTIRTRGITKLIHFTAKNNIDSINQHGILPKVELEKRGIDYHQNDFLRLDKHSDAICLSVSEPNDYLFREFSQRNPISEYQVIEINPKVLYELKKDNVEIRKMFFDYNAASRLSEKSEVDMEIMFKDRIRRKGKTHSREGLSPHQPTSSQAEILFFGTIPPRYFIRTYTYESKSEMETRRSKLLTISEISKELGNISSEELHHLLCKAGVLAKYKEHSKVIYSPSDKGRTIGIKQETRRSKNETYVVNVYNEEAVEFIKRLILK